MIIFQNPGLIEVDAITTMGLSAKLPGSFGMFGTGIKYGIATVLRGGGSVTIYRGREALEFVTRETVVREKNFQIVRMRRAGKRAVDLGFTTALGLNWEPWMVLREFGCNAKDEGGDFQRAESFDPAMLNENETAVVIDWPELEAAYAQRAELFLEGEQVYSDHLIRIIPRVSPYLYYRGVRAYQLEKPSLFTYDVLAEQRLTEDRTLVAPYAPLFYAARGLMALNNGSLAYKAITAGEGYAEHKFDFEQATSSITPGRVFIDAVIEARDQAHARLNPSARKVLLKQMRQEEKGGGYYGGYSAIVNDELSFVIQKLKELGVIDGSTEKVPVIPVPELGGEAQSITENGRIYILDRLLTQGVYRLASELFNRFMELRCPLGTAEEAFEIFRPLVLGTSDALGRAQSLWAEEQAEAGLEEEEA